MDAKALDKLGKLMALTTSDNDHEALQAVRAANRLLAKAKVRWPDVLLRPRESRAGPRERPAASPYSEEMGQQAAQAAQWAWDAAQRDLSEMLRDAAEVRGMFEDAFAGATPGSSVWDFLKSLEGQWQRRGKLTTKQREALARTARWARERAAAG